MDSKTFLISGWNITINAIGPQDKTYSSSKPIVYKSRILLNILINIIITFISSNLLKDNYPYKYYETIVLTLLLPILIF